jgi:excisionase family DNA binding protein
MHMKLLKTRLTELDHLEAVWQDVDAPWETLDFLVSDTAEQCARKGLDFYKDAPENPTINSSRCWLAACLKRLQETSLLTVKQAAERLHVSTRTIYDLVESGRLRCNRYGSGRGTIRIRPDDLNACSAEPPTKKLSYHARRLA